MIVGPSPITFFVNACSRYNVDYQQLRKYCLTNKIFFFHDALLNGQSVFGPKHDWSQLPECERFEFAQTVMLLAARNT